MSRLIVYVYVSRESPIKVVSPIVSIIISVMTFQNPKTKVRFPLINPYIFLNQSKTHDPNYNWEFSTKDNEEENERVGAHGRE